MDDSTLKAICEAKLNNALGWIGGQLARDRQLALSYYRGDPFGNEQDGRSKVVSRDVAEAVDAIVPSLIKVFATTDTVVVCEPQEPADEAVAKQATDYLNWVFQSQPNAFDLLQTWMKDGLLSKLGVVKSWWDTTEEAVTEDYEGLTEAQVMMLSADEDVDVLAVEEQPAADPGTAPAGAAAADMLGDGRLFDCRIRRTNRSGRIRIAAIPPEEFLTERRAVSLEQATFCAHRCRRTVSELIEQGYPRDVVQNLPGADDLDYNQEAMNRFAGEDCLPSADTDSLDPATRTVWIAECYLKVDYDGDGVAEWRKVTLAGGGGYEILDNETCEGHPFSAWTPDKQPHKLFGLSLADKTMDVQLVKSTVWRQALDGMYFNNAPQLVVLEGQANMEDVLTRRPGGVIRARSAGAVQPLPVQDVSQPAFAMINYLDSVREARTGVRRFSSGLEADALNPYSSTATGARLIDDASQDRILLIARNFAEQGLRPLFQRMLELTCKHQDKKATVRLRRQWLDVDPSTWNTRMDMTVTVGLGTGNRDTQVGQLMAMLTQIDAPLVQLQGGLGGPLLTAENVYQKLVKLTEAMGYKNVSAFYSDPASAPAATPPGPTPQGPAPNPTVQMMVAQNQAQMAINQNQARTDMALRAQAAAQKGELDRQKALNDMALDRMKAEHQMATEKLRATADIEIAQAWAMRQRSRGRHGRSKAGEKMQGPAV